MHKYVGEKQKWESYFAYPYSKGIRSSRSSVTLLLLEVPLKKFNQLTKRLVYIDDNFFIVLKLFFNYH